jgi:hypothetical protein
MKHRRFQLTSNLPPTRRELTRTWECSNFKPYRERKLEIFPTSFSLYRVWVPLYMLLPRRGPVSGFAKVAAILFTTGPRGHDDCAYWNYEVLVQLFGVFLDFLYRHAHYLLVCYALWRARTLKHPQSLDDPDHLTCTHTRRSKANRVRPQNILYRVGVLFGNLQPRIAQRQHVAGAA